ncbi:zinc-binding dehydrogenase [Sporomusa acidovorans]|uniref:zinc-binding dehydrogenase n=1 Tax=Sporomusa acidovorans TaxID=112900 RepID=UPI000AC55590|nr:zinc-binding dehydrogenase [Sporomusa acidovorans]
MDGKLKIAQKLGADITVNLNKQELTKVVADLTGGAGADVVVEAAGSQDSFNTASEIIKHNGKYVFYS